jgi:hypothetical protein
MLNILNMSSSHAIKDRENTYMHDTDDVMSGRSGGQLDRSTILRWGGYVPPSISSTNSCTGGTVQPTRIVPGSSGGMGLVSSVVFH